MGSKIVKLFGILAVLAATCLAGVHCVEIVPLERVGELQVPENLTSSYLVTRFLSPEAEGPIPEGSTGEAPFAEPAPEDVLSSVVVPTLCTDIPPPGGEACELQRVRGLCDAADMVQNNWCARTCGRPPCTIFYAPVPEPEAPMPEMECTDVPPDGYFTCAEQKVFGKCQADFMLAGRYCARTCGRAPCPPLKPLELITAPSARRKELCTDLAPPTGIYTCAQQRAFGQCNAAFMVEGDFCSRTCGRPPCPTNVPRVERFLGRRDLNGY